MADIKPKPEGSNGGLLIESFFGIYEAPGTPSRRMRVVEGQGIPASVRVSCSRRMRDDYPLGSVFEVHKWQLTEMKEVPIIWVNRYEVGCLVRERFDDGQSTDS